MHLLFENGDVPIFSITMLIKEKSSCHQHHPEVLPELHDTTGQIGRMVWRLAVLRV